MPNIEPRWIFAVLGPLFLLLAGWRTLRAGRIAPQAKAWFIVGALFSAVALWLWMHSAR